MTRHTDGGVAYPEHEPHVVAPYGGAVTAHGRGKVVERAQGELDAGGRPLLPRVEAMDHPCGPKKKTNKIVLANQ